MRKPFLIVLGIAATALWGASIGVESATHAEQPESPTDVDEEALERTRQTVRMLDNIYKQTIVLITDKYVHDEDDFPAGSAAVLLFERISKTGSHQVRLLDATGDPYDAANVAKDDFEKQGIEHLKAGGGYYDQIVQKEGTNQLRAITPVPVVMEKCIMCHPHYADVKEGEPIGAISYIVPIR